MIEYLTTSDSFMFEDGSIFSTEDFNALRTAMNQAWVERAALRGVLQIHRASGWWPDVPSRKASDRESILDILGLAPKVPMIRRRL